MAVSKISLSAVTVAFVCVSICGANVQAPAQDAPLDLPVNTWVKLSPLANTPPSPRLGYEGACVWDSRRQVMIRYGGHNQGGGGEQGSEIWTFEPRTARWTLMHTNTSPPGICCGQQNLFDEASGRYVRFPAFSGSHGWQWFREIYLNDSTTWTYDLKSNTWRNLRPWPTPRVHPLRCASWDSDHQVIVLFGGEGSSEGTLVYDPYANTWTRQKPPEEPSGRSGGNMAYDQRAKVHVLFGAQFDDDKHTWTYDLKANRWRDMQPETMPPTEKNDAVLCYDPAAGCVIAITKTTIGEEEKATHTLETWAYRAEENRWEKMNPPHEPDPSGNRARQLMYSPQLGAVLLENRRERRANQESEQQVWAYRPAAWSKLSLPLAPADAGLTIAEGGSIRIVWKPSSDARVKHWQIERGMGEQPWKIEFAKVAELDAAQIAYIDKKPPADGVVCYALRALDGMGQAGPPAILRTQSPVVEDIVVSVLAKQQVKISWSDPQDPRIVGYHIERAPVDVLTEDQLHPLKSQTPPLDPPSVGGIRRAGQFSRLTEKPVRECTFEDRTIDLSKPLAIEGEPLFERRYGKEHVDTSGRGYHLGVYAYRVRSVNARGEMSGPSPAVLTIPSIPQFVFSREDGGQCHLKWTANPEQGIAGYRVYRMDGRFSKSAIARLTEQPIQETTFTDDAAGTASRRYYIVAVDALGQEGHPSAPVWHNREWKDYYRPFVGEWHQ